MTSQANSDQVNREVEETKAKQLTWINRIFRDSEGNIVIAQMPNLPILVGLTASFLQFVLPSGNIQTTFSLIAYGALFTWAWQELFAGVNYFRRSLGLISLVGLIVLGFKLI